VEHLHCYNCGPIIFEEEDAAQSLHPELHRRNLVPDSVAVSGYRKHSLCCSECYCPRVGNVCETAQRRRKNEAAMQGPEATGELKDLKIEDVIEGLQTKEFEAIEDAARQHLEYVSRQGLRQGAYFAFNGKLFNIQGHQQVHILRSHFMQIYVLACRLIHEMDCVTVAMYMYRCAI
jgi:hypothetical protein